MRLGVLALEPELVRDGLHFPNGLLLDERRGVLYLAECCRDRILRARLDVAGGTIGELTTLAWLPTPDNLEMDSRGLLWVGLPARNDAGVVDPETGAYRSVFHHQTPAQIALCDEFIRRGTVDAPRLELLTPDLWSPLPGIVTGVILGPHDGGAAVYISGLGNALLRLAP
jgi:hypothetical protein